MNLLVASNFWGSLHPSVPSPSYHPSDVLIVPPSSPTDASGHPFPLRGFVRVRVRLNLDYVYTPSSRHSSSELSFADVSSSRQSSSKLGSALDLRHGDSVLDFRSSVDFYKVSLASRDDLALRCAGGYVTQIARKAQILLAWLCSHFFSHR